MFDLVIHGGNVIDGTGGPARQCDVAVRGDAVAAVGCLQGARAGQSLDARGLLVCPGFIDMHGHSDFNLLVQPPGRGKIMQGVTTEVIGNCGMSAAPLLGESRAHRAPGAQRLGVAVTWEHFDEFAAALGGIRLACNAVPLVGHGNIRGAVLGYGAGRPGPAQLAAMQELLSRQLAAGAWGLSTGLIYPPGMYAGRDEITALARTAARFGGLYATHMRSEGDGLLEAIEEALAVGREAGAQVQISHLKTQGKRNWHKLGAALERIEKARADGMKVYADRYPYTASSTGLDVVVPAWACEGGSAAELGRLRLPAQRARIRDAVLGHMTQEELGRDIMIARVVTPDNKPLEGLLLGEAAGLRGESPVDALLSLLVEEALDVDAVFFSMCEDNLREILRRPYVMIGSDASVWDLQGPLGQGKPHPRAFGSCARVLQKYVFAEGLLSLEEAVHKMTGLPARTIGLADRGVLRPGAKADLVLVRPGEVRELGDYRDPHRFPAGIEAVMVNGVWEVAGGRMTGAYGGRVLLKA